MDPNNTESSLSDMEKQTIHSTLHTSDTSDQSDDETPDVEETKAGSLAEKFAKLTCNPTDLEVEGENEDTNVVDDILAPIDVTSENDQNDVESTEDEDDDDNGWITPGKLKFCQSNFLININVQFVYSINLQ